MVRATMVNKCACACFYASACTRTSHTLIIIEITNRSTPLIKSHTPFHVPSHARTNACERTKPCRAAKMCEKLIFGGPIEDEIGNLTSKLKLS